MLRVISVCITLIVIVSLSACSPNSAQSEQPFEEQVMEQGSLKDEAAEEDSLNQQEPEPIAEDDVVNNFILSYNTISSSPITEVEDGNIRTKFFGSSYDYRLELLHANNTGKINVSIDQAGESMSAGVAGMRDVFHDVARTIDPSLSDDEIYSFFNGLLSEDVIAENQPLGSMLVQFIPDKVLSYGLSRGHIEISAQ